MIDLAIIVVSYFSSDDLTGLVASVPDAANELTWRIIVVNNAPDDDLSRLPSLHGRLTVIEAGTNRGYSGGINVGLREAPAAQYTVILNPDLTLERDALVALLRPLEAGAAAAVPLVRDTHAVRQNSLRREPSLTSQFGDAVFGDRWQTRPATLAETVYDAEAYGRRHPIEWATGAAIALRAETIRSVGLWDEQRFFMYSEETDYARRIRECGGSIVFVPDAVVRHRGGGSGRSPRLDALLQVNKLRYYRKWHGSAASGAFALLLLLRNGIRPHDPGARAAFRALFSPQARAELPGGRR